MDRYSVIVVSDETAPIRRFDVRKTMVRRAAQIGVAVAALCLLGLGDYVRVRIDHVELGRLRAENQEQRARIESFDTTVAEVQSTLERVRDFERKVRIIANLPGSAAAGGAAMIEVGSGEANFPVEFSDDYSHDLSELAGGGEDVEPVPSDPEAAKAVRRASGKAAAAQVDDRVSYLRGEARKLGAEARERQLSLEELVTQLEEKHTRLASSPAIWPTQGWLTSRFGTRISPFTGRRQFHAGIDVAGAPGTNVVATAGGRVVFAGQKGPMGHAVIIDHGHGVRTHYGHNREVAVKKGDLVERGTVIARLGNTGRSTGPHLHYSVEVKGKAVNPLDYIFD